MRRFLLGAVLVVLVVACGTDSNSFEPAEGSDLGLSRPPSVAVRGEGAELSLDAWTACWGNGCFDGFPPEELADIGSPNEVLVEFPVNGWEFSATVAPVDEECGRRQTEPLEQVGATVHRLTPIGLADEYEVTLFGRGPGGDLFVSFLWSTPADGVMPVPKATASIITDHDGELDSYGVDVSVWNLAAGAETAYAGVMVTSSEGRSHSFELTRQDYECSVGSLFLTAPLSDGLTSASLGTAPFTYEVRLEFAEGAHAGTGVWPDGEDPECAPCVPLEFSPPLPALVPAG